MLLFILGFFDVLTGIILGLEYFSLVSWNKLVFPMIYLFTKFLMFPDSFASYIEILICVLLVFSMLGLQNILQVIFAIYLIEKGIQSIILSN